MAREQCERGKIKLNILYYKKIVYNLMVKREREIKCLQVRDTRRTKRG